MNYSRPLFCYRLPITYTSYVCNCWIAWSKVTHFSFSFTQIFINLIRTRLYNEFSYQRRPMASTWHATYFVYSFSYLVLRTMAVSLYAASIYDQSKQPKAVLYSVPSESYCTEVKSLGPSLMKKERLATRPFFTHIAGGDGGGQGRNLWLRIASLSRQTWVLSPKYWS